MIKDWLADIEVALVSIVLTAVAAGITLVSIAFGLYAGLKLFMPVPAAAALTALIFAIVTKLIGALGPRLVRTEAVRGKAAESDKISTMKAVGVIGAAVLGVAADLALAFRMRRK